MPILTPEMVTLIYEGDQGRYFDNDRKEYGAFVLNCYGVCAVINDTRIHRLLPKSSHHLWEAQDPAFIEQLKTLFISQYIAGQRLVVEP